jgi:predicted unusual protein kinase regulating ubiquinone biosynthesis (AarF/ABC1/UbiB family)
MGAVTDLPRWAITRTAKLAALPLGVAGRAALGAGRRLGGAPAEQIAAQLQARTAEQLFAVLGELKGGAMKVGQALSILEAAMPEEAAAPYRATLTKLQDSAPSLPAETVHRVLAEQLGPRWRLKFTSFSDEAAASASIGQVHRATWRDGREVAVKIQYPGAGPALLGDFRRLSRAMRLATAWVPGVEIGPILDELVARVEDELDYASEARHQRAFAKAFRDDPDVFIPDVIHQKGTVLISEWVDGTPLSRIIDRGTHAERDLAGARYLEFLLRGPQQAKLLHADPHPGNFRLLPDGRLVVLDFGAVDRLPHGLPKAMGRLLTLAMRGDSAATLQGLRAEGFVKPGADVDAEVLLSFLGPFMDPLRESEFHFTRTWFRSHSIRLQDPRRHDFALGLQLNLPSDYLLIHRVWLGGIAVLSQMDSCVRAREIVDEWLPDAHLAT